MAKTKETLGQMLRRLREAAELTPEELAERAGVPLVSYRNWEYDHRVPGLGAASRVAKALGVPLQELADRVVAMEDGRSSGQAAGGAKAQVKGRRARRKTQ
jgi:transcriptional regulator with XRE-family HTH domain